MAVAYASPPPPAGAATAGCTQEQATEANPRPLHSNDHLPLAIPARNVTGDGQDVAGSNTPKLPTTPTRNTPMDTNRATWVVTQSWEWSTRFGTPPLNTYHW